MDRKRNIERKWNGDSKIKEKMSRKVDRKRNMKRKWNVDSKRIKKMRRKVDRKIICIEKCRFVNLLF